MSQLGNSPASRDIAYVLHGYTNHEAHKEQGPHILQGGKGIYVYDDTGKEFIEGMAGLWCTSLGYGEERLVEVATEQLRKLAYTHLFAGKSHDPAINLAEKLVEKWNSPAFFHVSFGVSFVVSFSKKLKGKLEGKADGKMENCASFFCASFSVSFPVSFLKSWPKS